MAVFKIGRDHVSEDNLVIFFYLFLCGGKIIKPKCISNYAITINYYDSRMKKTGGV